MKRTYKDWEGDELRVRTVPEGGVVIVGVKDVDRSVSTVVAIPSTKARLIARALMQAADELDRKNKPKRRKGGKP